MPVFLKKIDKNWSILGNTIGIPEEPLAKFTTTSKCIYSESSQQAKHEKHIFGTLWPWPFDFLDNFVLQGHVVI